jgi:ATP-binding protein involved in chromosome partitioning
VADPAGGDVVGNGRVRSLVIDGDRVGFALAAADPAVMEPTRRAAEAAVAALPGVARVLAAVVAETDAPAPEAEGLAGRARRIAGRWARGSEAPPPAAARPAPPPAAAQPRAGATRTAVPGVRRIVAVGSGKGGVGKSTVAVNLAVALSAAGWRVGLLDADIFGPSVPTLVGAVDYRPAGKLRPVARHGILAMSIGFLVEPEKAVVWRGPMVTGALNQLLRDTVWSEDGGELDCLLIDMPPGTGDVPLSLAQGVPLSGAVVVTTPQDLALVDVRKAVAMFGTVRVPILGVVENMATFVCPHCGTASDIFGHGGGEREAAARGLPFLGAVPLVMAIREASDAGRPAALDADGPAGTAYAAIAANLMAQLAASPDRPFPAIVFE